MAFHENLQYFILLCHCHAAFWLLCLAGVLPLLYFRAPPAPLEFKLGCTFMVAPSYFSPLLLFLLSSALAVLAVLLLLSATPLSDEVAADCGHNDSRNNKECT